VEHGGIRVGDALIIPFPEAASISATRTDRTRVLGRNAVDLPRPNVTARTIQTDNSSVPFDL
jgi:hypothetical protein